jgi:spermidine/putrescine transport system substrate-binding protein
MPNRRVFLMGVAGAATGCMTSHLPRLNVYNWENYVAASTIPDFQREFKCEVRYATYGSAEEMLAKVMSGNSGWDVVFPSNSYVGPMRELGLLKELDHQRLPQLNNLAGSFSRPDWDAELRWCVPYMYSATGIVYSKNVAKPPLRWADLWVDQYNRRITMMDDPAEVFGASLKVLRCSLNSTNADELRRARDLAEKQKPLLRAYLNEEVRDQVVAGDVLAAQMWAQVAQVAMDNSSNLAFAFPEEGFALYADSACILNESKHADLAFEFLNYLLRPQVAAAICVEMRTATANAAARSVLPAALRENQILFPPPDVLRRGEWFRALPSDIQRLRDRYWTEIKSS